MLERIGLLLSILYGTGVVALVQHSSLYLGFEEIDFLRIKPIIVGLQYYIYISIPFVATVLPFVVTWRCYSRTSIRILFGISGVFSAVIMIPMMLHYFMPCIYMADFMGITWGWVPIVANFWKLYLYWDCHWVGHCLIWISLCAFCYGAHKSRLRRIRKMSRLLMSACSLIGMIWLLYFFNRDFYMNISQAAGGGAPKAGIITIKDPCTAMSRMNTLYANIDGEISKPCFLLYEGDDYVLTSEMFLNHHYMKSLNENSITRSVFRHDKSRVVQFSPISYYQMWRKGNASIITNSISGDVIQHLGFHMVGWMVPEKQPIAAELKADYVSTNMPELVFWIENEGSSGTQASHVSLSPSQGSNIVCHIDFPLVSCQRGVQIWQWEHLMTNTFPNAGVRISNLPAVPNGFRWDRVVLVFNCNFIYPIELPWTKVILDDNTFVAHKKGQK